MSVQVMDEAAAKRYGFDLLDATRLGPEDSLPARRIGKMTLDRDPDNCCAETEQVACHTGNIAPGIDGTDGILRTSTPVLPRLGGPNCAEMPITARCARSTT